MNARKGNITVEPYTRSVRTVQREGRKSLNFPSTLFITKRGFVYGGFRVMPVTGSTIAWTTTGLFSGE